MKYKNTKTGAIINSSCKINGGNWVVYDKVKEEPEEIKKETKEELKTEKVEDKQEETIDGVTKKQIMQELDAMGIEYNSRANKKELYNLMIGK